MRGPTRDPLPVALCAVLMLIAAMALPGRAQDRGGESVFSQEEVCRKNYQTGQEYLKNSRLHDAAEAFTEVKEACPGMIDAYLNLGYIQVKLGEFLEAIDTYQDALDQAPENLDIKEAMAQAQASAGEYDDAIPLFLELHELRPEKVDILRHLAVAYKLKGETAEAVMLYNRLIELEAADALMVSEAGRLALESKLYLPAVTFYKKLFDFNPNDVSTLHILGGYYYKIEFYEEAAPYYEKILEIAPDHARALLYHKLLADCLKRAGNLADAIAHYEYILEAEPGEERNYFNLADALAKTGAFEPATNVIRRGLEKFPGDGMLYYVWGVLDDQMGRDHEAHKRFVDAIRSYELAKVHFQKVIDSGDPTYSKYAKRQTELMDQRVERVRVMQEKQEMGQ